MKRILVIEDTQSVREEIITILGFEGFKTLEADNGLTGIQLARKYLPDLIICDVMMPGLDGYGVLTELRKDSTTALIPFIFLTAKASREDIRQGMNIGADDYLTKPFTAEELITAIKTRLERQTTVAKHYTGEIKIAEQQLSHFMDWTKQQLNQATYYHSLTGLPNQLLLYERLAQIIQTNRSGRLIGVLVINLDRFKNINYALGRDTGDLLLKMIAERLKSSLKESDMVFHLQGDEFAILLPDLAYKQVAVAAALKLLQTIKQPISLQGYQLHITASIGISLYPTHSEDVKTLITCAETAMDYAKEQGRNTYQFYDAATKTRIFDNLTLENNLYQALKRNELVLYYQPWVDLRTGQVGGVEALIRWQHPDLGVIPPDKFILIAEETGLIVPLGEWVLRKACTQNKAWQKSGFMPLCVAVNFSGRNLQQQNLVQMIHEELGEIGLEPRYLELELTESVLVKSIETNSTILNELKALGIGIAIDDFGTGYSSLTYLKSLPVNALKIDQSFVRNITTNSNDAAIAMAIIRMAHSLGLQVIAEGVETKEQVDFLHSQGCDGIQGYFFSKPLSTEEFTQFLQEQRRLIITTTFRVE